MGVRWLIRFEVAVWWTNKIDIPTNVEAGFIQSYEGVDGSANNNGKFNFQAVHSCLACRNKLNNCALVVNPGKKVQSMHNTSILEPGPG